MTRTTDCITVVVYTHLKTKVFPEKIKASLSLGNSWWTSLQVKQQILGNVGFDFLWGYSAERNHTFCMRPWDRLWLSIDLLGSTIVGCWELLYLRHVFISQMTRKASKLLIWARAAVLCFSKVVRLQLMYPLPPIRVVTVLGVSILGMSVLAGGLGSGGTGWRRCMGGMCAEEVAWWSVEEDCDTVEEVIDWPAATEEDTVSPPPPPWWVTTPEEAQLWFDWKLAFRDTQGEGLSDPDSELLEVAWAPPEEAPDDEVRQPPEADDPLESMDQVEDMSRDLGLEDFILILLSRVETR